GGADTRNRGRSGASFAQDLSAASAGGSTAGNPASGAPSRGETSAFAGKSAFEAGFDGSRTGRAGQQSIVKRRPVETRLGASAVCDAPKCRDGAIFGTKWGRAPSKYQAGKEIRAAEADRQEGET